VWFAKLVTLTHIVINVDSNLCVGKKGVMKDTMKAWEGIHSFRGSLGPCTNTLTMVSYFFFFFQFFFFFFFPTSYGFQKFVSYI
jgi:hypothetical protein